MATGDGLRLFSRWLAPLRRAARVFPVPGGYLSDFYGLAASPWTTNDIDVFRALLRELTMPVLGKGKWLLFNDRAA